MALDGETTEKGEKLDEHFVIRRIQNHVANAINAEDGDVTQVRQLAYARYMGELYGNEREGYSQFTTRDALDAVEWALPALMRIFTGGVRPVEFRPINERDVKQAKHETEVVHQWFSEGEDAGFMVIYSIIKDCLLYPNGYVNVSPSEQEVTDTIYDDAVPKDYIEFLEAQDAEVTIEATNEDGTADIVYTLKRTEKSIIVAPSPPDHTLVDHGWHKLSLDGCPFVCLREQKTYSDLRRMGFTEDQLEELGPDDEETWNDESVARYFYEDEQPDGQDDEDGIQADELYWTHDCYMHIDVDQDGISEPRHIFMVGCKILENEPCDFMPTIATTAIPQTHKHIGMGLVELVMDLQLLKTTLWRQLLDNVYRGNNQRKWVSQQALLPDNATMDAVLDGDTEIIPVRGRPGEAVMPEVNTPMIAEIGEVISQVDNMTPKRTGVAPDISLDPGVLEKATMGAFVGALEQASQRLELLARVIAETAIKPIFLKMHACARDHFDEPVEMEIAGQWVQAVPSQWRKRTKMKTNVGIGFNNKQVMLTLLESLLRLQREVLPFGLADEKKVYNTLVELIDQSNLGHAASFFLDPNDPGWKKPPPTKTAQDALAEAQAKALEAEAQRKDFEVKAKHDEAMAKIEAERDIAIETAKAKGAELNLKLMEHKLKVMQAEDARALNKSVITKNNRDKNAQDGPAEDSSADEYGASAKPKANGASAEA